MRVLCVNQCVYVSVSALVFLRVGMRKRAWRARMYARVSVCVSAFVCANEIQLLTATV